MSKTASLKAAYSRGGVGEVIRASRRWLARVIDPGPGPQSGTAGEPGRHGSAHSAVPGQPAPSALNVDLPAATAWFERRHDNYVRLSNAVAPYLADGGDILDVGANIGYFTKVLADTVGLSGTAHLFEPIPHLVSLCEEVVETLDFPTVVHDYGLSDSNEAVDIHVDNAGNLGWNTLVEQKVSPSMSALSIEVRRFDDLGLDVLPTLIKVDVEGAEYRVFRGMMQSLREWSPRPVILCEVGWGQSHPSWDEELQVLREVEDLGYTATDLAGAPIDIADLTRTTDILLLPR